MNQSFSLLYSIRYFKTYGVKIQIRDNVSGYPLGVECEGFAFCYTWDNTLRFFKCTCKVPSSNMIGWTTPIVRTQSGAALTIYVNENFYSAYTVKQLEYITGQYYSTLNVGTIFQYSNVSRYDNRLYRDSSGAVFPYEDCLIEWINGKFA